MRFALMRRCEKSMNGAWKMPCRWSAARTDGIARQGREEALRGLFGHAFRHGFGLHSRHEVGEIAAAGHGLRQCGGRGETGGEKGGRSDATCHEGSRAVGSGAR